MRTKLLLFYCLIITFCSSCGTAHFLKPAQLSALDKLGKGLTAIGNSSPDLHLKLYDIIEDNKLNTFATGTEVYTVLTSKADTIYKRTKAKGQPDKIDTLIKPEVVDTQKTNEGILNWVDSSISTQLAAWRSSQLTDIERFRSAWALCNRYSELLIAVANPEFGKALKSSADSWKASVDSAVNKYNFCFPGTKLPVGAGTLFSSLAQYFGTRKIKREQQKFVEKAIDTGSSVITRILETVKNPILKNVTTEIEILQTYYGENYKQFQLAINKDVIDPAKAKDLVKDLSKTKVALQQLQKLQQNLIALSNLSNQLMDELQTSLKSTQQQEAALLKSDTEKMEFLLQETDIITATLK